MLKRGRTDFGDHLPCAIYVGESNLLASRSDTRGDRPIALFSPYPPEVRIWIWPSIGVQRQPAFSVHKDLKNHGFRLASQVRGMETYRNRHSRHCSCQRAIFHLP